MPRNIQLITYKNICIVVAVAISCFVLFQTVAMISDIVIIWQNTIIDFSQRVMVIASLYFNPLQYGNMVNWILTAIAAVSIGVQFVLYATIKKYRAPLLQKNKSTHAYTGAISSILISLGMGCAACGSLVLLSLISVLGIGMGAQLTMWIGDILLFAACVLLLYANVKLYRQLQHPFACDI